MEEIKEGIIPLKNLGYFTFIISQIFRYLTVIIVMTLTGGIGILFIYFFLAIIPFKISLYPNFKEFIQNKINVYDLQKKWKKKLEYAIILTSILLLIYVLIIVNDSNNESRFYFTIFFFALFLFISPLFIYLKKIKQDYFKDLPVIVNITPINTSRKKFSLYNFYFDNNTNSISTEKQTKSTTDKSQISENIKNYSKKIAFRNGKIFEKLSSDEVIIISIIIGSIFCLFAGNIFGETQYFFENGERTTPEYSAYTKIDFNYIIAVISFIITAGISYIFLNRKSNNTN